MKGVQYKSEMDKGLKSVESKIKKQKDKHPKWLDNDEVLEKINKLFEGNVGGNYEKQKLEEIKKEGSDRYEKKIPPGFKDKEKPEDKKYGDLILWKQIIDKAIDTKKPIILISGDVKEDWWLENNGKRLMPLPQLKKELFDKAGVDFHIYTADRFLELYQADTKKIDEKAIKEVRKIRELEEERMMRRRMELIERERNVSPRMVENYLMDIINNLEMVQNLINSTSFKNDSKYREGLEFFIREAKEMINRSSHGESGRMSYHRLYRFIHEILFNLKELIHSEEIDPKSSFMIRECINRLQYLSHRLRHL